MTIAVKGGEVAVSDLVLKHDIYYTLRPGGSDSSGPDLSWPRHGEGEEVFRESFDILSDPTRFPLLADLRSKEFVVGPGRYFMMGDNSPQSSDSRMWTHMDADGDFRKNPSVEPWADRSFRESWEVPESHIIGKAFFIYWPHGKPFGPDLHVGRDYRLPFRPYLERMKFIR